MEYRQIVAVTGLGGLYQLMSTKKDGAIIRSLADQSIKFISSRVHQITPLESIEIYTYNDNVRLHTVLSSIQEKEAEFDLSGINKAKNDDIKKAFKIALPEFDEDRVYVSDIKKVFKWYSILKANDLLHFEEPQDEATEEITTTTETETTAEKPKKKATKKSAASKEETVDTIEEKPAKKTAAKKASKKSVEDKDTGEKPAKKPVKKKEE